MLINGMTLKEMANYLVSLSSDQLNKLGENYSGFQVPLGTKLNYEDSIFFAMYTAAGICKIFNDNKLKEFVFEDLSEGEHCVVLAEMRKRNLI